MIKCDRRYNEFTFHSYVNYFTDPGPLYFDHEHDASGDGISDADTYWLSSDPLIDGRAHPLRKDVFVEVDWMEGVDRLSDEAKWHIGTRFYENDIWLHIDARFTPMNQRFICILENGFPADDGKMGGGGEVPYQPQLDSTQRREYYETYFTPDRINLFRYGLMADELLDSSDDPRAGFAIGDRFYVADGWIRTDPKVKAGEVFQFYDIPTAITGTFMHELGHTFGLSGKNEDAPGYFEGIDNPDTRFSWQTGWWTYADYESCMNYRYIWTRIDYSDGTGEENDHDDWTVVGNNIGYPFGDD